jgi:hypothetical protein
MERRQFIRNAAVASTLAWTAPSIVSVDVAAAKTRAGSAPPTTTTPTPTFETPIAGTPMNETTTAQPAPESRPESRTTGGSLPFTGDSEARDAAIGAAVVVLGVGVVAATTEGEAEAWT